MSRERVGRPCTVCNHPERQEIDKALVSGTVYRKLSETYGLAASSLCRHRKGHIPAQLVKAFEAAEMSRTVELVQEEESHRAAEIGQAIDVVRQLKAINAACLEILQSSRADGKHAISLKAVDRIHRQIELQAKLLGELQDNGPQVNILVAPQWREIRVNVLQALGPYPEARLAVARVLGETSNGR
jgi:hypothetical protein